MTVTHYSSLETLAGTHEPSGAWWVAVARALDDLDERLAEDTAVDEGPTGAFVDAVTRQPSLSNDTTRLAADHARLIERARCLRRLVAEVAGDPGQASAVAAELAGLAAAEERYRQRSRAVFWDSFSRDIGGE
jgi:erythromycin esterase-like protein